LATLVEMYDEYRDLPAAHQARDPGRDPKPGQLRVGCFASWMADVLGLQAPAESVSREDGRLALPLGNAQSRLSPPSSAASLLAASLSLSSRDAPPFPVGARPGMRGTRARTGPVLARFGLTLPPKRKSAATRHLLSQRNERDRLGRRQRHTHFAKDVMSSPSDPTCRTSSAQARRVRAASNHGA